MRTDTEMMNLILQIAESLQVEAVALSGSWANPRAPKDEFQDYDVVYIVDDLEDLISDLSWLDQYGNRLIEQHNVLGHRRLISCSLKMEIALIWPSAPKESIQEWVDSEANFEVIKTTKAWFEPYQPNSSAIGPLRLPKKILQPPAMNFGGYRLMSSRPIRRNQLIYATDHLYGICQQELLKVLAWQVTSDKGVVDIGKNYSTSSIIYQPGKRRSSRLCLIYQVSIKSLSLYLLPWGYSIEKLKFWPKRWDLLR